MHDLRELQRCIVDVVACHIVLCLDESIVAADHGSGSLVQECDVQLVHELVFRRTRERSSGCGPPPLPHSEPL